MIYPPASHAKNVKPVVSMWHRDIGDLLSRTGASVRPHDLAVFCRELSFLLGAGVPVKDVIPTLLPQTEGRLMKQTLPDIHNKILQGEAFASALAASKVFPVFMCGFITIGEMTAQLPRVCEQLADFYERQAKTRDELAAALLYPTAVTLMMLGVIIMAVTVVLPGYSQVFDHSGVALPALTRGLLGISAFMTRHAWWLAFGLGAVILGVIALLRSGKGRNAVAAAQLRFTLFRQGINLRLVQSLNLMLGTGQSVSGAMPVCAEVMGNTLVKRDLLNVHGALAAGRPFWATLTDLPYIDPLLVGLARVGEETGSLSQTMAQCQIHFTQTYQRTLRRLNKLVEPIITLTLGFILALVMLAIVLPTFELATAV
ncbi:MAG: type II secretion system F family protein [Defluviitaleaceae bacterium]|nr:type II secretion system F family protein [Defluviitaleaceae bacterium]